MSKPQHQKKRKSNESAHPKNKKSMELVSAMIPSSSAGAIPEDFEVQTDKGHLEVTKKIFHIGGKRYLVFYGRFGQIEEVIVKEWDGEKVINSGVRLNISKFLMILHNVEVINQSMERIFKGEQEISKRIQLYRGSI